MGQRLGRGIDDDVDGLDSAAEVADSLERDDQQIEELLLGDVVGCHFGVVVGGDSVGAVSVCGIVSNEEEEVQRNSIFLRKSEKVVSSTIYSICPIAESVVCLGCYDNNCHLFDFIQNERIFTLEGHTDKVEDVTFDSKTSLLCSGSDDRTIRLWKVNTTDYTQSKEISQLIGHTNYVFCVRGREEIWPNRLLSGSNDRTGRIWDLTTQKEISVLRGHRGPVYGIDLSSNGDYIVTGLYDKTVYLWDTNTVEKQTTVNVGEWVHSLFCAQKRPNTIAVGGEDHVFIYDPRNLSNGPVSTWQGFENWSQIVEIDSNRFVHNCGRILRNYDGRILREWDVMRSGCCYVPPFLPSLHDVVRFQSIENSVLQIPAAARTISRRRMNARFGVIEILAALQQTAERASSDVFCEQLREVQKFSHRVETFRSLLARILRSVRNHLGEEVEAREVDDSLEFGLEGVSRACFVGFHGDVEKRRYLNAMFGLRCFPAVQGSSTLLWHVRFGEDRNLTIPSSKYHKTVVIIEEVDFEQRLTELSIESRCQGWTGSAVLELPEPMLSSLELIDTPPFGGFRVMNELILTECASSLTLLVFVLPATHLVCRDSRFHVGKADLRLLRKLKEKLARDARAINIASRSLFFVTSIDQLTLLYAIDVAEQVDIELDVFRSLKEKVFPSLRREQVVASSLPTEDPSDFVRARSAISHALFRRNQEILGSFHLKFRPILIDNLLALCMESVRKFEVEKIDEMFLLRKVISFLDRRICETLDLPSPEDLLRFREELQLLMPSAILGPTEFQVTIPGIPDRLVYGQDMNTSSYVGVGQFGTVFRGVWWKNRGVDVVAVKRVPKTRRDRRTSDILEEIKREMEISLRLRHPNVVETYETGEDAKYWYIVMELCEGASLKKLLVRRVSAMRIRIPLPEDQACRFLLDIAAGLHYLHSYDPPLIHRDLNPGNLLLDTNGRLKICDFGTARYVEAKVLEMTVERGTLAYMAPELIDAIKAKLATTTYTNKVDIYSLGMVFYEMLTGKKTLSDRDRFSGPLFDLCDWLMASDPLDRPSADQILAHPDVRSRAAVSPREAFRQRFVRGLNLPLDSN